MIIVIIIDCATPSSRDHPLAIIRLCADQRALLLLAVFSGLI